MPMKYSQYFALISAPTQLGRLTKVLLLSGLAVAVASAQQSPAPDAGTNIGLDELVVIGSLTQARSIMDSPVPVDVFSREDLLATGAPGNQLGLALSILAPSFNFPQQSNSVTSDHISSPQLRGMSPDQILVLINGKRKHSSAVVNDNTKIGRGTSAVDLNTIPLSAVKRVEILRDGASAQYGTDAIAGVINIILDDRVGGTDIMASYGVNHSDVAPIDRSVTDGQTVTAYINHGFDLQQQGFVRVGAEFYHREATNRAGLDLVPPFFIIPQTPDNLALAGQRTHRVGDPETDDIKLWLNTVLLTGAVEWYGFASYAWRDTEGADVYRYPDDDQNVREIFPNGFLPVTLGENRDLSATAGARYQLGEWQLDNSIGYGRNEFDFGVRNSLNASLGPASPTEFDSGSFEFEQFNINLDAGRAYAMAGLAGPLEVAVGAAYRHESFASSAGDPASFAAGDFRFPPELEALVGLPAIGSQAAIGLSPEDTASDNRDVLAAYTELSAQLTPRLFASVSGRFEDYDDFGSTGSGKLALSYAVVDALRLRGSVSNSFRAPALSQINWQRRTTSFGPDADRIAALLARPGSAIGQALGASELDEETAFDLSFGFTADLSEQLDLTVDVYRIRVDDRITLSEFLEDDGSGNTSLSELVQNLPGGQDVESVAFFTNAVDTRTLGTDVVLTWDRPLASGQLSSSLAYSYAETDIRRIVETPAELQAINPALTLVGVEEINTIESATPQHQLIINNSWRNADWQALVRMRFHSSAVRVFSFASQRFGPETAFDVELGRRLDNGLNLVLGARNLFDNVPDLSNPANNFFGNFAFDVLSPIGINGRFVYGRVELAL